MPTQLSFPPSGGYRFVFYVPTYLTFSPSSRYRFIFFIPTYLTFPPSGRYRFVFCTPTYHTFSPSSGYCFIFYVPTYHTFLPSSGYRFVFYVPTYLAFPPISGNLSNLFFCKLTLFATHDLHSPNKNEYLWYKPTASQLPPIRNFELRSSLLMEDIRHCCVNRLLRFFEAFAYGPFVASSYRFPLLMTYTHQIKTSTYASIVLVFTWFVVYTMFTTGFSIGPVTTNLSAYNTGPSPL